MGVRVTYLDCMDCEDKECMHSHEGKEKDKMSYLASVLCEPNDIVYLVLCAKKQGAKKNIVFKGRVEMVTITVEGIRYHFYALKCTTDKETNEKLQNGQVVNHYRFGNSTINNGYKTFDLYSVFTTKEKCVKWLRE
jgi:hypothetical protein